MTIGDKVKHKSGGPDMVISSHDWTDGRDLVTTKWWNDWAKLFATSIFDSSELIKLD